MGLAVVLLVGGLIKEGANKASTDAKSALEKTPSAAASLRFARLDVQRPPRLPAAGGLLRSSSARHASPAPGHVSASDDRPDGTEAVATGPVVC